jgi:hypothetical protein
MLGMGLVSSTPNARPRLPIGGLLLLCAAGLATLWGLGALADAWERDLGGDRIASGLAGLWPLVCIGAVGRVLLAWMPPGFPGEHGLVRPDSGGLAATWAASHLLGIVALALALPLQGFVESQIGMGGATSGGVLAGLLALLAIIALVVRPGTMVPRHGMPGSGRASGLAKALLAALLLVGIWPLAQTTFGTMRLLIPAGSGGNPMTPVRALLPDTFGGQLLGHPATSCAAYGALLILMAHALTAAHMGRAPRRFALLLFALLPAGLALVTHSAHPDFLAPVPMMALLFTGGTALGYVSLRRADRRAAILALISFTGVPFLAPAHLAGSAVGLALAGLLSLLVLTPGVGRARIAKLLFTCLVITIAAGILRFPSAHFAAIASDPEQLPPISTIVTAAFAGYRVETFGILFAIIDATGLALILRRPWRSGGGPDRAQLPRPELAFLFAVALLGWVLAMGAELVVEGKYPMARLLWNESIVQLLVLLAGPGMLMACIGVPALFPAQRPVADSSP